MPLAQYKKENRYRYIDYFKVVDNTLFDATISGNLCITTSMKERNDSEYIDFLFYSFDHNYRAFYEWNKKNYKGLQVRRKDNKPYTDFDIDLDFVLGSRAVKQQHCISITGKGFDYYWNVLREGYKDKWINRLAILHFDSKKARDNFTMFIYSKVGEHLISKVLRGLNLIDSGFFVSYAIPQIDWDKISEHPLWKEGRYDEAVLDAMGLRWENDSRTKIVKKD